MKTAVYLAIVLFLISGAKSDPPAPILSRTEDVTLDKDQTFRIQCTSDTPVLWYSNLPAATHSFSENVYTPPEGGFGNELTLEEVTVDSVGYYYCIKKNVFNEEAIEDDPELLDKLVEVDDASKIYLFVRDLDVLIVPAAVPFINANKGEDTIIPCKPTTSDTPLELVNNKKEIMSSETSPKFDPKKGFVINIRGVAESGDYKCRPKYSSLLNDDESIDFMVEFVNSNPPTDHIHPPTILSETDGHGVVGGSVLFRCYIEYTPPRYLELNWVLPSHVSRWDPRFILGNATIDQQANLTNGKYRAVVDLMIKNVRKEDDGYYNCTVKDHGGNVNHHNIFLTVLNESENYVNLNVLSGAKESEYTLDVGKNFQIAAEYKGFPRIQEENIVWLKNGVEIQEGRYKIKKNDKGHRIVILSIDNVSFEDRGNFTLEVNNTIVKKSLNFVFKVRGKPSVSLKDVYVKEGEDAVIDCTVLSYPEPYIVFEYQACELNPEWPSKCKRFDKNFNKTTEKLASNDPIESTVRMKFTPEKPGYVRCLAQNKYGDSHAKAELLIGDIEGNFTLEGFDENQQLTLGDELVLKCSVLKYNPASEHIYWDKDGNSIKSNENIFEDYDETKYSRQRILRIPSLETKHNGIYSCNADDLDPKVIEIQALPPEPLAWQAQSTPDKSSIDKNLADALEINCQSSGLPRPEAKWFKDGVEIVDDDNFMLSENNEVLSLKKFVRPEDEGQYTCKLTNRLESIEKSFKVNVLGMTKMKPGWIFFIIFVILMLIASIIYLAIKVRRKNIELKKAGLYRFAEGNIEHYNPALDLDEQAELLPYDEAFEVPRESLKLGKQLGAGAFGVVVEAIAHNIVPGEENTKVAVKMVKRTADNEVIMALVSELKIMIYMGKHLNVVNLLGAVTKKIAKREIMIIVEHCRYGNVQNILMKNRKYFINQINPETDKIDPTIKDQRSSACEYEQNINGLRYVRPVFKTNNYSNDISASKSDNDPRSGTRAGRPNSRGYIQQSEVYDSCNTEQTIMTTIPEGEGSILSNNSVQPAWRSNYKVDNTEGLDLTTSHLIQWAFQVARGMDYLASKKVLHGDLAARNILLCDDNVVKICDFGLARSMLKGDNYKKQGEARLPIKWLALESLESQVFSTYTDVWSFGIVLWEFFSLAKVPYPGMEVPNFLNKLKDGYRMEKPAYANQDLYDIMLECWNVVPESRPLFHELENKFGVLLGENDANHYMQLNAPYMLQNSIYFSKRDIDLDILRPPERMAPKAPPIYVNGNVIPQIIIDKGNNDNYLQMNANVTPEDEGIFSPTRKSDEVFNYPTLQKVAPEEIPMLAIRPQNFSDSEGEQSPDADSRSRGFHELNHSISSTDDNNPDNDYLDSSSYLGMKNGTRDAFSNPSYHILKTVNEK